MKTQVTFRIPFVNPSSITGRDGYIELQALAYAIVAIELRPTRYQEWSNREDMVLVFQHLCPYPKERTALLNGARAHLTGVGHPATA
jgi:hypothetical protein